MRNYNREFTVVYRLNCSNCSASYIGKTERILVHRLKEHQKRADSAFQKHEIQYPNHRIDFENVEILDRADNNLKLEVKELLHIVKHKPSLSKQLNPQSKFNIKTLIIAAYPQNVDEADTPYHKKPASSTDKTFDC